MQTASSAHRSIMTIASIVSVRVFALNRHHAASSAGCWDAGSVWMIRQLSVIATASPLLLRRLRTMHFCVRLGASPSRSGDALQHLRAQGEARRVSSAVLGGALYCRAALITHVAGRNLQISGAARPIPSPLASLRCSPLECCPSACRVSSLLPDRCRLHAAD